MEEQQVIPQAIIRFPALKKLTGLSRSSIYRKEVAGKFPRRRCLGENSVGWVTSEVLEWISKTQQPLPSASAER